MEITPETILVPFSPILKDFTAVLASDNQQLWEVRVGQKLGCVAQGVCVKTDGFRQESGL